MDNVSAGACLYIVRLLPAEFDAKFDGVALSIVIKLSIVDIVVAIDAQASQMCLIGLRSGLIGG